MTEAALDHGANVLRALAANLGWAAGTSARAPEPPLDHPSARDAVTLLGWRGQSTSDTLQEALGLSQPACVRVVDRLVAAGLVTRRRQSGDRRVGVALTAAGERAAQRLVGDSAKAVRAVLRTALADDEVDAFVRALDRVATAAFGTATDTARFCRSCDVPACLRGPDGCPSAEACRANLVSHQG
jgi:DNA-binding MarR family transcriptional regulator